VKCQIDFQLKLDGQNRPLDQNDNDEPVVIDDGQLGFLPAVGDTVSYTSDGNPVARKVLSRHFLLSEGVCCVNIVVTDLPAAEYVSRISE
jgi:hypothetical protein